MAITETDRDIAVANIEQLYRSVESWAATSGVQVHRSEMRPTWDNCSAPIGHLIVGSGPRNYFFSPRDLENTSPPIVDAYCPYSDAVVSFESKTDTWTFTHPVEESRSRHVVSHESLTRLHEHFGDIAE